MVQIRQGNEADCEAVLGVLQAAFGPYVEWLDPPPGVIKQTVKSLRELLGKATLLVGETNGESEEASRRIIACLFYARPKQSPDGLHFFRLAVLPAFQRQGIARQLITAVEEQARIQGCKRVTMGVRIALPDNVRYYQSLGYEIFEERTHEGYTHPTYYVMSKLVADAEHKKSPAHLMSRTFKR